MTARPPPATWPPTPKKKFISVIATLLISFDTILILNVEERRAHHVAGRNDVKGAVAADDVGMRSGG